MRSIDELLEEAKWGQLTQEELDYVVNRIKESRNKEDPNLYTLIYILGKSGAVEYRKLIENFVYYPTNPDIAYVAFSALVNYMDLLEDYIKEVRIFLKGVAWDEDERVRIAAIGAAGRYLTGYEDKEFLAELIRIFYDLNEDDTTRSSAYTALADAVGRNMNTIFGAEKIDFSILDEAKLRLARCK